MQQRLPARVRPQGPRVHGEGLRSYSQEDPKAIDAAVQEEVLKQTSVKQTDNVTSSWI